VHTVFPYAPKKDPRERGKRHIRGEPAPVKKVHESFAGSIVAVFKGGQKRVISCAVGTGEESPEDPGPNAVCGFATPQRQVSSGPNAESGSARGPIWSCCSWSSPRLSRRNHRTSWSPRARNFPKLHIQLAKNRHHHHLFCVKICAFPRQKSPFLLFIGYLH
jgi:hypothetical protein